MSDYISRQAAIEEIRKAENHAFNSFYKGLVKAHKIVADLSSADVVPVVRCRDCKYNSSTHKCLNPDSFFLIPKDDDFCSFGERREE